MNSRVKTLVDLARKYGFNVEPHPTISECWVVKEQGAEGYCPQLVIYQTLSGMAIGQLRSGMPSQLIGQPWAEELIKRRDLEGCDTLSAAKDETR